MFRNTGYKKMPLDSNQTFVDIAPFLITKTPSKALQISNSAISRERLTILKLWRTEMAVNFQTHPSYNSSKDTGGRVLPLKAELRLFWSRDVFCVKSEVTVSFWSQLPFFEMNQLSSLSFLADYWLRTAPIKAKIISSYHADFIVQSCV